jgi:hypothetical protein
MQNPGPILEAASTEALQLTLDALVLGVASVCALLSLAFVVAVIAGVVAELRGGESQRNVLSRGT